MSEAVRRDATERPRLRAVEAQWIEHAGERLLMLRDRTGVAPGAAFVPAAAAPLLALCDGTRTLRDLCTGYALRTSRRLLPAQVEFLIGQLDEALLLEGARFQAARRAALADFRAAPFRPMALAPHGYPDDPGRLALALGAYGEPASLAPHPDPDAIRAVISPHIDYGRGGPIYARVWWAAAEAVRRAEQVVILATDHNGGAGRITPTRQSFMTPHGVLPTHGAAVDALAEAVGPDWAFEEELNHRFEHSIELVAVWLHHVRGGAPCPIVPVLVGSFHEFVGADTGEPAAEPRLAAALAALGEIVARRRTLIVVSGDLAHVGPAFGDDDGLDAAALRRLRRDDEALLGAVGRGDAGDFFGQLRAERDRRRICGLPPVYLALRVLGDCQGEVVGYDQCPADDFGASWVSVAGAVLTARR